MALSPTAKNYLYFLVVAMMIALAAGVLIILATPAHAQEQASAIQDTSVFMREILNIVAPIFLSIIAGLASWIATKIATVFNGVDETRLKNAIHDSAINALKYAFTKLDVKIPLDLNVPEAVVKEALDYVRTKNPDAINAFGLDDGSLKEIILSKAPDVIAIARAAEAVITKVGDTTVAKPIAKASTRSTSR